ncbi:MAG TPA: hypothetical protein PKX46_05910, partial [Clostridia bacterium]|nr:hypothetical protein [Clostridia bacterium]
FAVAFIMLRSPKLTASQAQVQEEGAAINTDTPAPSRYIAFRNALLTKEGPPDEVLIHAAYMREQALDPEPIITARSAAHKSTVEAETPEVIAVDSEPEVQAEAEVADNAFTEPAEPKVQAEEEVPEIIAAHSGPQAIEEAEAPEIIAAYSEPEVQEEAGVPEVIAAYSEPKVQAEAGVPEVIAAYSEPKVQEEAGVPVVIAAYSEPEAQENIESITAPLGIEVEEADADIEPALKDLLDHAYTAMEAEDWQTACTAFKTALPLASEPYYIQRIKLELLNMLMRTGRKREAVDLVFDILSADYALSSAETATLFNVLQDLQKGA